MFKYSKDGVSVSTILDTRRIKKSGLYPVKTQVIHKRIQKYFPTGKEMLPDDWEKLFSTRSHKLQEIRRDIGSSFDNIKKQVQDLTEKDMFSFEMLSRRLGRKISETLNDLFRERIKVLAGKQHIGNMMWYRNVVRSIERFESSPIQVREVTVSWLQQYEKFLTDDKKSATTVSMYMRAIRAIMNEARKNGQIRDSEYPFGKEKFEIKEGEGRKKALTIKQIEQIVKYDNGSKKTAYFRDLWFFIYLCNGINVADLIKLKYSNIVDGEICFIRQKTENTAKKKREIFAAITPEMSAIIKLWGNCPKKPDNYIFPFLKGRETPYELKTKTQNLTRRINWHMHIIGKELDIGNISTYTARHSFATVLKRGGANIIFISESLGHNDLKTTSHYLAGFEKEERVKNASILTNFNKK